MEQDGGAVAGERDRKGDLKSAAEECLGNTEEEGRESTHTHTCVCVCVYAGNSPSASCLEPFLTGVPCNSPAQLRSVRKWVI